MNLMLVELAGAIFVLVELAGAIFVLVEMNFYVGSMDC